MVHCQIIIKNVSSSTSHKKLRLSVFTSISLYVHTSLRPYVFTSIRLYVHTSLRPYIFTSIRLYVHTSLRPYVFTSKRLVWAVLSPFPSKREGDGSLFCALTRSKFLLRLSMILWGQFYVTERFCDFLKRHNLLIKLQPWLTFL